MTYAREYLQEIANIADSLIYDDLEKIGGVIRSIREAGGTLYIIGLGGSAANAMHMSADLRKLCEIDARSLDNLAEITARANDEGWITIFDGFKFNPEDGLFVLSVGGGTHNVSTPLIQAINRAVASGATVMGVVGPDGGFTARNAHHIIKIPAEECPTPYTEAFQAVIWHYLCSHPALQKVANKW